jgi:transcriptional regulator with XRE-family HTH domain
LPASAEKLAIAARLKAARMALGWDKPRGRTQAAFYRSLDIGNTRGNNWEKGIAYPDVDFLIRLDTAYGIEPGWILCGHRRGLPDEIRDAVADQFNKILRNLRG